MNFIVLVSDTFRYDNLAVGGGKARTPDLDRFVARANLFANCYVSSFPTLPHRTDCFTGGYCFPSQNPSAVHLSDTVTVLAECLSRADYLTQLLCDTPHLLRSGRWFGRGFHGAYVLRGQEGDTYFTRMNQPIPRTAPAEKTRHDHERWGGHFMADLHTWTNSEWVWEEDRFCARTARLASKWLELNYEQDGFLLWVDMFDPHEPWDPPEYMVRWFDSSDYDGPPMIHPNYDRADKYTQAELCNLVAHYRAEASLVSKWMGHVLHKIEELELMENTAIIFTTDHGMLLGEHNRAGKANRSPSDQRRWPLYQELSHIPLAIHIPGVPGGRVFSEPVQPPDLLPTLLDLAGLDTPEQVHGRSLGPLLRGESRWERAYAVGSAGFLAPRKWKTAFPMVTDGRYTYHTRGEQDTPELYDLVSDPTESHNIVASEPARAKEMHGVVIDFLHSIDTPEAGIATIG